MEKESGEFPVNPVYFKLNKHENVKNFKCSSLDDALDLMLKRREELSQTITTIFLVDQDLKGADFKLPKDKKDFDGLLISFESSRNENQKIFVFKSKLKNSFTVICLDEGVSVITGNFIRDFLQTCLSAERYEMEINFTSASLSLAHLLDANGCNMLMRAVNDGNKPVVEELLHYPFDVNATSFAGETAADIAWAINQQEILLILLRNNSTFPSDFNVPSKRSLQKCSCEIQSFVSEMRKIHEAVRRKNVSTVETLLQKKPTLRHFYEINNTSAMTAALQAGAFDCLEKLQQNHATFGPHEDVFSLCSVHANGVCEPHILTLLSRTIVSGSRENLRTIVRIFEALDVLPITQKLMRLTALAGTRIFFYFSDASQDDDHPWSGAGRSGVYCFGNGQSIVIKQLPGDVSVIETSALVAAKACLLALVDVFGNSGRPYTQADEINKNRFEAVIEECRQLQSNNKIITSMFERFIRERWSSELIATVPQLEALYQRGPIMLQQTRETFASLFYYYESVVTPALDKHVQILEKLNDETATVEYSDLTEVLKARICNGTVNFQGREVEGATLISNENEYDYLTPKQIREALDDTTLTLIGKPVPQPSSYVKRKFISGNTVADEEEFLKDLKHSHVVILRGDRGAGKSTVASHIAKRLKRDESDRWVEKVDGRNADFKDETPKGSMKTSSSFSDMKKEQESGKSKNTRLRHSDNIKDPDISFRNTVTRPSLPLVNQVFPKCFPAGKPQIRGKLTEILGIKDDFEKTVFENCFKNKKITVVVDNIDENHAKESLVSLINNTKCTKVQVLLTARPSCADLLGRSLNATVYELAPLEPKEVEQFIKHIVLSHTDDDVDEVIKMTARLHGEYKNIKNPLVLRTIVNVSLEHPEMKISDVFEEVVKVLDPFLSKNCETYEKIAVKNFMDEKMFKDSESSLNVDHLRFIRNLSLDKPDLSLLKEKNTEKFIDETLLEFFVSKFLTRLLYGEDSIDIYVFQILINAISNENISKFFFEHQKRPPSNVAAIKAFFQSGYYKKFLVENLEKSVNSTQIPTVISNLFKIFHDYPEIYQELAQIDDKQTVFTFCLQNNTKLEALLSAVEMADADLLKSLNIPENFSGDFLVQKHNYEVKENLNHDNFIRLVKLLKIIQTLNDENLKSDFLEKHFHKILNFAFRSSLLVETIFKVFPHTQAEDVMKALAATHIHNYSLFYEFSDSFMRNYEDFWMRMSEISGSNLRSVLLGDFKDSPLTLALRYNMRKILDLYIIYCSDQIQISLFDNVQSLIENLEEVRSIEILMTVEEFLSKIFNKENLKMFLTKEFTDDSLTVLSYLKQAHEEYLDKKSTDRAEVVKKLLNFFNGQQGETKNETTSVNVQQVGGKSLKKRALGVKFFNTATLLPAKHRKRENASFAVPEFDVDP